MRMRHWICAAALSSGLLIGGVAAFSAYATSVEIEDAKKQVSALEEEKKKVESTLNQLEGLKADTAAYVKKLDGSLSSLAEELEQLGNRIALKEEEIDQAQIQLESAKREEEHQYDSMKLRIKYMYENGHGIRKHIGTAEPRGIREPDCGIRQENADSLCFCKGTGGCQGTEP